MTLDQITKAVETQPDSEAFVLPFRKGSSALSVATRLKRDGVSKGTIDRISGSDWYEFVKACGEDLVD